MISTETLTGGAQREKRITFSFIVRPANYLERNLTCNDKKLTCNDKNLQRHAKMYKDCVCVFKVSKDVEMKFGFL